jgi:Domain of unknown function (DUF5666)
MQHFARKTWVGRIGTGLAALLTVGLASAAVGGISLDSKPLTPKVKAAEIVEGTVSSVISPPSSGVGPVFAILDGEVTIDASGADVVSGDPAGGPAVVQVGSRIVALLAPVVGGSPDRMATTVYVLSTTNTATLHGRVSAVDQVAMTFRVTGVTVNVTAATVFGGTGLASLGDLHVGDIVLVVVSTSGGSVTAERVMRLGTTPTPLERIEGTIVSIGTTSWVLSVGGKDMTIVVDAQTKILGAPKAGDTVEVLGRTDSAGVFQASLIVPEHQPSARLRGTVVSESSTSWVIAVTHSSMDGTSTGSETSSGTPTNVTVSVDSSTKIVGAPAVGDMVDVLATKQTDGSLLAKSITKVTPPPPEPVKLRGTVVSEGPTSWVIAVIGPPMGGAASSAAATTNTTVMVDSSTKIVGAPAVGDAVEVLARKQTDGSLLAALITKVASPMTITFQGVVNGIKDGEWTVGTTKVIVSHMTVLVGSPKLGDTVKVEGVQPASGTPVVATKITKV